MGSSTVAPLEHVKTSDLTCRHAILTTMDIRGSVGKISDASATGSDKSSAGFASVVDASRARGEGFKQLTRAEMREKRRKAYVFSAMNRIIGIIDERISN
ncbi:hypothetical protein TanjilG_12916 [Lupinus angustifolius]|uniref:Uncharacterized protein n=1 Tax=Lupinus angustifolius TaxID=3871 RepID=A0A1J7GLG9_LUPAN|nr:hypothetical protein TanjilG_12916 [Lupinus angustifolius]